MKLYYYPIDKLTFANIKTISIYCVKHLIGYTVEFIRDKLCFIFFTSTIQQEELMDNCPYVADFSVLNINNVLELLDYKKGE